MISLPAPTFVARETCENDGGTWVEPVARLELDASALAHPLGVAVSGEQVVALATLGTAPRKALTAKGDARTLLRVDFDGDGAADAQLRTGPTCCGP